LESPARSHCQTAEMKKPGTPTGLAGFEKGPIR
jgi:hypothetical protein